MTDADRATDKKALEWQIANVRTPEQREWLQTIYLERYDARYAVPPRV